MAVKIIVNQMKVSDKEGKLKAFCSVDIAGKIEIFSCKLMESEKGLWVAMPQRKGNDDKWYDNVRIKDEDIKNAIATAVIAEYKKVTGSSAVSQKEPGEDNEF